MIVELTKEEAVIIAFGLGLYINRLHKNTINIKDINAKEIETEKKATIAIMSKLNKG